MGWGWVWISRSWASGATEAGDVASTSRLVLDVANL